jgi:hypothetical protein
VNLTVARTTEQLVALSLDCLRVADARWVEGMRGDGSRGSVPLVDVLVPETGDQGGTLALLAAATEAGEPTPHQGRWTFVAEEGFGTLAARLQVQYLVSGEHMELRLAFRIPGHDALLAGIRDARRLLFRHGDGPTLQVDPPTDDLAAVLRIADRAHAAATP